MHRVTAFERTGPWTLRVSFGDAPDFDPATLHRWPQVKDAMVVRARTWGVAQRNE